MQKFWVGIGLLDVRVQPAWISMHYRVRPANGACSPLSPSNRGTVEVSRARVIMPNAYSLAPHTAEIHGARPILAHGRLRRQ